ncbi:MAG: methionyl-tRNA formyltransferase [Ignavibacteria bacterium]|nr:methionyl-tRNA formyltransferase [Ignavibacteria bacterium]
MKIIFMGTPEFAVPSLKILLDYNYDIAAVVTTPDKKKGRGLNISISAVKKFAVENNLIILQPESLKSDSFIMEIISLEPDLIIVVAFKILPREIFSIPKYGSFNLHASLLPKFRGAAPINWALINGETETGVTSFFLKEKVDTGNIIIQEKIKIDPEDDAETLHDKLSDKGAQVVLDTVRLIEKGNLNIAAQDDALASPAPKIFKQDCLINWDQGSVKVHNFIRGLSPYPAAFTYLGNKVVKIFKTRLSGIKANEDPGGIRIENKKLFTAANDNELEITELQIEGKKRITAVDFINGIGKDTELRFTRKK